MNPTSSPRCLLLVIAAIISAPMALAQPADPVPPPDPAATAPTTTEPAPPPTAEPAPETVPAETAAPPSEPPPAAPPPPPPAEPIPAPEEAPPAPPPGPEFLPLSVSGSFWSRYELREGFQEHGLTHPRLHREGDYIVSRARLGIKTTPVDLGGDMKASATFVPQAAYTFGTTGTPVTIADSPPIVLYEGYASVGGKYVQFDAGRFAMDYGDALIIGNLGWNESARAFNGGRFRITPTQSPMYIDAFATLVVEGRGLSLETVSGDTYFYGLYAGLGPLIMPEKFDLDVYVLGQTLAEYDAPDATDPTITLSRESATQTTVGARVKGGVAIIDYRVEAGVQFGKTTVDPTTMAPAPSAADKSGFQVDGEIGVTPVAGLRIMAGGFMASGNDPTTPENEGYDELYPTGHKWLGLTDVVGPRTNVAGARAGLSYGGLEWLKASVDFHNFTRLETDATMVDGAMGNELDFNLAHPFGKGAAVRAMYGVFLPDEAFWEPKSPNPGDAGDPIHFLEVQFGYEFK